MKVGAYIKKKGYEVIAVDGDLTVADAIDKMVARNIGALLIKENGSMCGMFTERDVLKCVAAQGEGKDLPLSEVMTRDLIVAQSDDDMSYVMSIMIKEGVRHLPVVEGGTIIGLLSIRDVVQAQVKSLEAEVHYLKDYITSAG